MLQSTAMHGGQTVQSVGGWPNCTVPSATNAQIARSLSFSVSTIRDDTTSIYRKLQVKGRAEAVGKAIQLGLIAKPSE
ncbi:MAG: response regulator transcription factor [Actinomycetota bacterium]